MAFKTEDFKANFNPQRTELFEVAIQPPSVEFLGDSRIKALHSLSRNNDNFIFKIESAELPAKNVQTIDHRYYGAVQKIATQTSYIDTTFSFLVDENYEVVEFFNVYMDLIGGNVRKDNQVTSSSFETAYYDQYKSNIQVYTYTKDGKNNRVVELVDAYPITMSSINLNWGQPGIARLNVTFTYRYFRDAVKSQSGGLAFIEDTEFLRPGDKVSNSDALQNTRGPRITKLDRIMDTAGRLQGLDA